MRELQGLELARASQRAFFNSPVNVAPSVLPDWWLSLVNLGLQSRPCKSPPLGDSR